MAMGQSKSSVSKKYPLKKVQHRKWPDVVDIHDYPVQVVKQEISVPRLLPGGSRNIVFEVYIYIYLSLVIFGENNQ